MRDEFLWVEKYRPKSIDDCILSDGLKKTFSEFVENKEIPNLLLTGSAGVGKTTVARALCEQLDTDYILINGSEESGIDVLRNKIKSFASTVSLSGGNKVVILDEADYLNPQSTQPALRGFIEEFSKNCRFILTCNFLNRIITPLHSRTSVIDFKIPNKILPPLADQFLNRVQWILESENIKFEIRIVVELIMKHVPDWRRVLNELQRYSASGIIDIGILTDFSQANIEELAGFLKSKNFGAIRKWVAENLDNDPHVLYRKIYEVLLTKIEPTSVPDMVLVIADYVYKSAFVVDQEINLLACLSELFGRCQFL
ncbi:MAG: DNA polymerase [Chromatiales bacterium]|jgi:DNA polymerase III delta prime subunit|nr:DNA polymerase [Chromatiales bacterium]|tara:strand:+ start:917 stop:1855 length:939 start_codon:yes stop_codon:yes gene_type:complete